MSTSDATGPSTTSEFDPLSGYSAAQDPPSPPLPTPLPLPKRASTTSSKDRRTFDRPARASSTSSAPAGMSFGTGTGSNTRRRRAAGGAAGAAGAAGAPDDDELNYRVPLSPPRDPELFETDEDWKKFHADEPEGWPHYIPLLLVAVPSLGAIIHGRAENWSDGIILILVAFYLYQLVKVPWTLYRAAHARTLVAGTVENLDDEISARRRAHALSCLRRNELFALLMTALVPALGSYSLLLVKGILSDPERYINKRVVVLFAIATSIKPFLHFVKLAKNNSLYHQEAVWYPSTEVHLLRRRVDALERDLAQLSRAFATKDDVRILRDGVDVPLLQLSKAVRRFDRKEEYLRLSSEERFAMLDARLEDAQRDAAQNAAVLDHLRADHERYAHPVTAAMHVLGAVLGHQFGGGGKGGGREEGGRQREVRWFEKGPFWLLLWPVNVSSLAIEWVSTSKSDLAVEGPDKPAKSHSHSSPSQVMMSS